MKNLCFLLFFLGAMCPMEAQFIIFGHAAYGDEDDKQLVIEEYSIEDFTSLEVNGLFNVYLRQSDTVQLEIEGYDYMLPHIEVVQNGDRLVIEHQEDVMFRNWKRLNLYIAVNNLEHLEINGVGDLICEEALYLDHIDIECAQMGRTELNIHAQQLDLELTKVGKVYVTGQVEKFDLENTSLSQIDAYELQAQFVRLDNNSLGKVRVWAEKELEIRSAGLGTIYCKGKPDVKRKNLSGLARIRYL